MATLSVPSTMKAWQYSKVSSGGLEKNLVLNSSAPLPKRKPDTHLIQVLSVSLNPVDYKVIEMPLVAKMILPKKPTPVIDFAGRIVEPAEGSNLQPGQLVFGHAGVHLLGGALAQYTLGRKDGVALLPDGMDPKWGAAANIAGLTAHQSIVPYVKEGSNVFINGGSGGTGIFGIQIAKLKGCYVTTTCSTANVELCKSLGADEVIDYKEQNVLDALRSSGRKYDHVVDNVGSNAQLYWRAHDYTSPRARYMTVGVLLAPRFLLEAVLMRTLPGFLGGGRRTIQGFQAKSSATDLKEIGGWMRNGQVKPVIDSEFAFEHAPSAFERLKTGRARGKIVVEITHD